MIKFDKVLAERTVAQIIKPKGFSWQERQREWVNGAKWGWTEAQKQITVLETENAAFHEQGLAVYGSKIQLLNKRIKELEEANAKLRKLRGEK